MTGLETSNHVRADISVIFMSNNIEIVQLIPADAPFTKQTNEQYYK